MKPQRIGRVLGTGLRVAGRVAGERLAASTAGAAPGSGSGSVSGVASGSARPAAVAAPVASSAANNAARRSRGGVMRGLGGFVHPFARVGGTVFLEVAGVFFLLFVLVFGQMAWRLRDGLTQGPHHAEFLVSAALMLVFLYLCASSFWRVRRR